VAERSALGHRVALVLVVVVSATASAGDHYVGKKFGWLFALLPMAAYLGYLLIFRRRRSTREIGEP
jgi:hypothetical protein